MIAGLSARLLWEHRWRYSGLVVLLAVAATLAGTSLEISSAASSAAIPAAGLTRNEVAIRLGQLESGRDVSTILVAMTVFVTALLVFQSVSFIVEGRRREFALLRLNGAGRTQIVLTIVGEVAAGTLFACIVGSFIAMAVVDPYAQLLVLSNNWPAGLRVHIDVLGLLWSSALVLAASVSGAFFASVKISRVPAVAAVRSVEERSNRIAPGRIVAAVVGVIAVCAGLALPGAGGALLALPALVGAGTVLFLAAISPFLLPTVALPFALLSGAVSPRAAELVRAHLRFDRMRAGAVATPVLVLLGLGATFGMFALTGRAFSALAWGEVMNTNTVVVVPGTSATSDNLQRAEALPEVGALTSTQATRTWSWSDSRVPADSSLTLEAIDPTSFRQFIPATVVAGGLLRVSGDTVAAVTPSPFHLGDSVDIQGPGGNRRTVRVVAIVEGSTLVHSGLLINQDSISLSDPSAEQTWFVRAAQGVSPTQLDDALRHLVPSAVVTSRAAWVAGKVEQSVDSLSLAIVTIVGGAALFALIALSQAIMGAVRGRRDELSTLREVGASRQSLIGGAVSEGLAISLAACLIALVVAGLVYVRMSSALAQAGFSLKPIFPTQILILLGVLCVGVAVTAAGGASSIALARGTRRSTGIASSSMR